GRQLRHEGPEEIPGHAGHPAPQPAIPDYLSRIAEQRRTDPAEGRRRRQAHQGKGHQARFRHQALALWSGWRRHQTGEGIPMTMKVEQKLFENRYRIDEGNGHVAIKQPDICRDECTTQSCTWCCPAGCYVAGEDGEIVLTTDGCLECGTCRLLCAE